MPPFEPKTDSKEFEVALPVRPNSGMSGAVAMPADITVRLWHQQDNGNSTTLNWNSESVLVYMVADLVAASNGHIASDALSALAAHFEDTSRALVAARRIQLAILEFVSCKPSDCLGAAILIHPPSATGFSAGMVQNALRLSEPGQIILSEMVTRALQDLPGVELRPVVGLTTGGRENAGLSELVWASADQIAKLRACARASSPALSTASQVGATMIVNAPLGTHDVNSAQTSAQDLETTTLPAASIPSVADRFQEELAELHERQVFITGTRVVVALVALVIIGAGVALFYPQHVSKVPAKAPLTQTEEPQLSSNPTQTLAPPPVPPTAHPVSEGQTKTAVPSLAQKTPKQPVPKTQLEVTAKKTPDSPIQGFEGNSTYDGMTQRDIPRLLQWARSDAGNGRYEKAAQEYRVILQLQPNNSDAKEGLRKIQLAQGSDQ